MKTYEQMAQSALRRIDEHEKAAKQRRKRIIAPVGSLCLAAIIAVGAWQSGLFDKLPAADDGVPVPNPNGTIEREPEPENVPQQPILHPGDDGYVSPEPSPDLSVEQTGQDELSNGVCQFWWKSKLVMYPELYWAIQNEPDGTFDVLALFNPATANVTSFSYEGRTLADWAVAASEENASEDDKAGYKLAYNAYLEVVLPEAMRQLGEIGIECERAAYRTNGITFTATSEQLKNLPLDDIGSWIFDFSTNDVKGSYAPAQGDAVYKP